MPWIPLPPIQVSQSLFISIKFFYDTLNIYYSVAGFLDLTDKTLSSTAVLHAQHLFRIAPLSSFRHQSI